DKRKTWHEEHKDKFRTLREKMRDAHQAEDKEAVQAVREEIKALMQSAPKPDAAHDEVRALLTEEQQTTFDERITKMRERMEQWKERRGDGPPHGRRGFSPDDDGAPPHGQRFEGRRRHGARVFGNLDLTDDQKTQLRETMQSDKTREEKMAAVREMLSDEQKTRLDENLKKMREFREKHKGERGEHRGRRGDRDGERDGDRPRRGRQQDSDD
ncbi:MAG: hypothetical protein IIC90_01940, partial [Chloroflexi bacterium]|nr:hypothetical protein [Chloroflexota bacterium]